MTPPGRKAAEPPEEPRGRHRLQPQDLPAAGMPSGQRGRDQRHRDPPEPPPRSHARKRDEDESVVRDDFRVGDEREEQDKDCAEDEDVNRDRDDAASLSQHSRGESIQRTESVWSDEEDADRRRIRNYYSLISDRDWSTEGFPAAPRVTDYNGRPETDHRHFRSGEIVPKEHRHALISLWRRDVETCIRQFAAKYVAFVERSERDEEYIDNQVEWMLQLKKRRQEEVEARHAAGSTAPVPSYEDDFLHQWLSNVRTRMHPERREVQGAWFERLWSIRDEMRLMEGMKQNFIRTGKFPAVDYAAKAKQIVLDRVDRTKSIIADEEDRQFKLDKIANEANALFSLTQMRREVSEAGKLDEETTKLDQKLRPSAGADRGRSPQEQRDSGPYGSPPVMYGSVPPSMRYGSKDGDSHRPVREVRIDSEGGSRSSMAFNTSRMFGGTVRLPGRVVIDTARKDRSIRQAHDRLKSGSRGRSRSRSPLGRPNSNWPDRYVNKRPIAVKLGPSEDWQRRMREKARGVPDPKPAPVKKASDTSTMRPAGLPSKGSGPWRKTTTTLLEAPARDPGHSDRKLDRPRSQGKDSQSKRGRDQLAGDDGGNNDAGKDPLEKKRKGDEKGGDSHSDTTRKVTEAERKLVEAMSKGSEKKGTDAQGARGSDVSAVAGEEGNEADDFLEMQPVGPDPNDLAACPLSPSDKEPEGDTFQQYWRIVNQVTCYNENGIPGIPTAAKDEDGPIKRMALDPNADWRQYSDMKTVPTDSIGLTELFTKVCGMKKVHPRDIFESRAFYEPLDDDENPIRRRIWYADENAPRDANNKGFRLDCAINDGGYSCVSFMDPKLMRWTKENMSSIRNKPYAHTFRIFNPEFASRTSEKGEVAKISPGAQGRPFLMLKKVGTPGALNRAVLGKRDRVLGGDLPQMLQNATSDSELGIGVYGYGDVETGLRQWESRQDCIIICVASNIRKSGEGTSGAKGGRVSAVPGECWAIGILYQERLFQFHEIPTYAGMFGMSDVNAFYAYAYGRINYYDFYRDAAKWIQTPRRHFGQFASYLECTEPVGIETLMKAWSQESNTIKLGSRRSPTQRQNEQFGEGVMFRDDHGDRCKLRWQFIVRMMADVKWVDEFVGMVQRVKLRLDELRESGKISQSRMKSFEDFCYVTLGRASTIWRKRTRSANLLEDEDPAFREHDGGYL